MHPANLALRSTSTKNLTFFIHRNNISVSLIYPINIGRYPRQCLWKAPADLLKKAINIFILTFAVLPEKQLHLARPGILIPRGYTYPENIFT